ncbi:MAG TPA: amidohydrolase family protein [Candidatus Binatia bacterium]|nr:amidohydrolase family protein [Candidatus Binatia bacterium]
MAKDGFKIIDSDMHVMEPPDLWERYIDAKFRALAPRGVTSHNVRDLRLVHPDGTEWARKSTPQNNTARGKNFDQKQDIFGRDAARGWTSEVQLEAMDTEGIDVAVLYPTRGLRALVLPNMDADFAAAMARAYNDWLYDFCQRDSNRLIGAGMISTYRMEDAVTEARRCAEQLGFRAIFLRANPLVDHQWQSSYYDPLWDALEALNLSLGFHESTGTGRNPIGERLEPNFMLRRVFSQPMEQMLALGCFCGGGVLARHPKLRVAFLEANCSWLPWLLWRLDEAWELDGDVFAPDLQQKPSDYFKRQCRVSIEPDEVIATNVIEQVGSDYLVFSTDYPHVDSRYPEAVNYFLRLPLRDEHKRKILWDNCMSYYAMAE